MRACRTAPPRKGKVTNWCIATTSIGTTPYLQTCGANGTVWIAENNGDGCFLYSRYLVNAGYAPSVLAVKSPFNGDYVNTLPDSEVGGANHGRWSDEQNAISGASGTCT